MVRKYLIVYIKRIFYKIKIITNHTIFSECHKVFALLVRGTQELKEKFFSFIITDEEVNKTNYLQTLCRQMALAVRVADAVSYILFVTLYINLQITKSVEKRFCKVFSNKFC